MDNLITEEQINKAFENTNFGSMPKRDLVRYGLLKVASGYYNGHTLKHILIELGLVNASLNITKKRQAILIRGIF